MHPTTPALVETLAPLHPDIERVALLGWHCYPASATSRAACAAGLPDLATTDLDQLERWAHRFRNCNWRCVCGPSSIWGLDVDVAGADHKHDGRATLERLIDKHGALPMRPTTRSGGGGWLLVFAHDGRALRGQSGAPGPGLDPLRGAQTLTLPPSRHIRTGNPYRWVIPPWEINPPPAPDWLLQLLTPPPPPPMPAWARRGERPDDIRAARKLDASVERVRNARDGQRNDVLNREAYGVARWVAAGFIGEAEAIDRLYIAARACGMEDKRARNVIRFAWRKGVLAPIVLDDRP
jgi:hypothetical protein